MYAFVLGRGCRRRFLPALSGMADERAKARFFEKKGLNGEDRLLLKPLPIEKPAGGVWRFWKIRCPQREFVRHAKSCAFWRPGLWVENQGTPNRKKQTPYLCGVHFFYATPRPKRGFPGIGLNWRRNRCNAPLQARAGCQTPSREREKRKPFRIFAVPDGVYAGAFLRREIPFPRAKIGSSQFPRPEIRRISAETGRGGRKRRICRILRLRQTRNCCGSN